MATKLHGVPVKLYQTTQTGTDDFGAPIYTEEPVTVDNVLVGSPTSTEVQDILNLTGKKVVPFCTNEGSGMGSSERELKKICKGAEIASGLSIHGAEAAKSESKVASWAKKNV